MKIAYVCYLAAWRGDGVGDKIAAQIDAWTAAGHEAELHLLHRAGPATGRPGAAFAFAGPLARFAATRRLYAAVAASHPDLIYLRYDLFIPPPAALTRIAPTVVEINSNARAELAQRSKGSALYERIQEQPLLRRAAGAVCVTHELAAEVARRAPSLPLAVIANGIALDSLPELPAPRDPGIRAVYLGDNVYWQGIDKVFALARALPDWQFDLVGVPRERSEANVTCHGFLGREQYEPIVARADIGLGTLALHRKAMDEACALKVRRYLGYGLPVVLGHSDTDFAGEDPWYLLQLPNTETNVQEGSAAIRAFGESVKGRRVGRAEIENRISVEAKEAQRLVFLTGRVAARDGGESPSSR